MTRRGPVALARRSSVRIEARGRPLSRRATTGCVVPIFRASSSCVRPARLRASITADARANSSSRASYAFRYFGSFIHFLCRSVIRAIAAPPSLNQFRACEGQLYLAPWRLLRFLHEDPHNHHAAAHGGHIERSRDSATAL